VSGERETRLSRLEEQMQEGAAFASTLVGMTLESATEAAKHRGFKVQVVPPSGALTADLNPMRVRLQLDDENTVTWAHAG
jgi:hypothetical protein